MKEKQISSVSSVSSRGFSMIWDFFVSIKLSVIIFLSLALSSIIGTLIPQNGNPAWYIHKYGETVYKIFKFINIIDMYHSLWFQTLLIILAINIIVCSIDRFKIIKKIIFIKQPSFDIKRFKRSSAIEQCYIDKSLDELIEKITAYINKSFGESIIEKTSDNVICIFAEKGRWTRLGVYVVHLSIIFMLLGGLIGSLIGFESYVNIPEGESASTVYLKKEKKEHKLPFEIKCNDFNVSFYDNGTPKEYRSNISILENSKEVLKKDIIVNHPLRYKGINIFQSSYGTAFPTEITLNFESKATGMTYVKKAKMNQEVEIPEGLGKCVVNHFINSYNFRGHNLGDTFFATLTPNDKKPVNIFIPFRTRFDKMRGGDVSVSITNFDRIYYTGLQITKDPGVILVYIGFIILIIGCYITFFMDHQRIGVEITKNEDNYNVIIGGIANKNKFNIQNKIKFIAEKIYHDVNLC